MTVGELMEALERYGFICPPITDDDLVATALLLSLVGEKTSVAEQIAWTIGDPPKDGATYYGHCWQPYRWKAYSPKSEQFRHGIKGRWQAMNEYGGWDNAKAPDEWATKAAVLARHESPDASGPASQPDAPGIVGTRATEAGGEVSA